VKTNAVTRNTSPATRRPATATKISTCLLRDEKRVVRLRCNFQLPVAISSNGVQLLSTVVRRLYHRRLYLRWTPLCSSFHQRVSVDGWTNQSWESVKSMEVSNNVVLARWYAQGNECVPTCSISHVTGGDYDSRPTTSCSVRSRETPRNHRGCCDTLVFRHSGKNRNYISREFNCVSARRLLELSKSFRT
jgi:hypothetical protein